MKEVAMEMTTRSQMATMVNEIGSRKTRAIATTTEANQGQAQTVSVPIIAQVQLVPAQIQNADTGANRATGQPQTQASCSNVAGQNFQQGSTTNPTT